MSSFTDKLEQVIFIDLLAVMVLAPLAYGTVEAWSIALFELNALLLAVLLSLRLLINRQILLTWHRLLLPQAVLLLCGVIQILPFFQQSAAASSADALASLPTLSLDPTATTQLLVRQLALMIYFVAFLNVFNTRDRWRRLLNVVVIFGAALALFAIVQKLTWNGRLYWVRPIRDGAPFGPFVNYNHFAGLMEMIFPLAFAGLLFRRVQKELKGLWFFATVLIAGSVILSLSRGGMLSLGAELLLLTLIVIRRRRTESQNHRLNEMMPRVLIPLMLAVIAVFALWIGYDQIVGRLQYSAKGLNDPSLASRLDMWRNAWQMFRDHPLLGVGTGAFPTVYPAYGHSSALRERLEQAHNDYLQLLTDVGLVGGLIGLWFLLELLRLARRHFPARASNQNSLKTALSIGSLTGVAGLLIHSLTDFNLQITSNAFYFVMLIALAASLDLSHTGEMAD